MPPEHLVLHLHAIATIEELMASERLVLDGVGPRMERAGHAECRDLGIFGSHRTPSSHCVNYNTYTLTGIVNEISTHVSVNATQKSARTPLEHRPTWPDRDEITM